MKKILYIAVIALLSSCSGFLEEYSQDLVVPKTIQDLNETILGSGYIPSYELDYMSQVTTEWFLNFLDDDVNTVKAITAGNLISVMNNTYYGYYTWQLEVGRSYDKTVYNEDNFLWDGYYARINVTNTIINEAEKMMEANPLEVPAGNTLLGECHFLRAQFYLLLANIYCDAYNPNTANETLGVPIKTTHYVELEEFPRPSLQAMYDLIISDLEKSVEYFENGVETGVIHRASKAASQLLLSRVYLYTQQWEKAKNMAIELLAERDDLINMESVVYDTKTYVINESSRELIFSQGSLNMQGKFTGGGSDFCITRNLYDLYSDDDFRKDAFFLEVRSDMDSVRLGRKYRTDFHISRVSDLYSLRTAEGYLNAAEGAAFSGDATTANKYLNALKATRYDNYQDENLSIDELISEIRDERRRELALEGHRWFDLRRYAVNATHPYSKTIEKVFCYYDFNDRDYFKRAETYVLPPGDKAYTFAIPSKVLEFNPEIERNDREARFPTNTETSLKDE